MMVIYLPVKFEIERTHKQTELQQFQKQLSYDGDLSPCQV